MSARRAVVGLGLGLGLFVWVLVTSGPRSLVDWRAVRAVALQSDDWGLAGFVPAADSWEGLDRSALQPGHFPAVYWQSTLEDAGVVDRLSAMLAANRGRDGVPAVFQPNYVMSSLGWDEASGEWTRYDLPAWPPQYARPGLWAAVSRARRQGVWHPEFHAALHYDPARRREAGVATALSREASRRGISLFPDSEGARELAPWRPAAVMAAELDTSLAVFVRAFGRRPGSVIAPDYTWHAAVEDMWQSRGLRVIQAKREQRNPQWLGGRAGRVQKFLSRPAERLLHPGRAYLERNCRLEPMQSPDPQAVVTACLAETRRAWQAGQPAVVETHRINYAHTDPGLVARGVAALAAYLAALQVAGEEPVFVCDVELADLQRRGTSWRLAGERVIVRNGTRSARVVAVPAGALKSLGAHRSREVVVSVPARTVLILSLGDPAPPVMTQSSF